MADKTVAVFIDADNISPALAVDIFKHARNFGEPIIRRAYGTVKCFSNAAGWQRAQREYGIVARPLISNVPGKNIADIALVIDAMEVLYKSPCDGVCIVSNDSDFTALASKIREGGKEVYGFGGEKAPVSFRSACTKFVVLPKRSLETQNNEKGAPKCPRCGEGLIESRTKSNRKCRTCTKCGGMSAKITALQNMFSEDGLNELLRLASEYEKNGCVCPECGTAMSIVKVSSTGNSVEIDVCAKCKTVWYDKDEFETILPNDGVLQATVSAGKAYRRELAAALAADLKSRRLKIPHIGVLKSVLKKTYHTPQPDIEPVISFLMSQKIIKVESGTGKITVIE